jgi:hypothetical protein
MSRVPDPTRKPVTHADPGTREIIALAAARTWGMDRGLTIAWGESHIELGEVSEGQREPTSTILCTWSITIADPRIN